MSSNGSAKISDFGLARDLDSTYAAAGTFVGTAVYMAPERMGGTVIFRSPPPQAYSQAFVPDLRLTVGHLVSRHGVDGGRGGEVPLRP